jgi:hypothetical protein
MPVIESRRQGWVIQVVPGTGESFGHYLSRFRRENYLSHKTLGEVLSVPTKVVSEWEVPSRRRIPDAAELERLSCLVGIPFSRLREMLPPTPLYLQTRLCPACYAENPVHQAAWQQQGVDECDRHRMPLLSACPNCGTGFRTPSLWWNEQCEKCQTALSEMTLNPPVHLHQPGNDAGCR